MLRLLRSAHLKLCLVSEVDFISRSRCRSEKGIQTDAKKIQIVQEWRIHR